MPGAMERRLRDFPELIETLRKLGRLRRRILRYFTEGQFHFQEGLTATGCVARLYCHAGNILVLATNPSDEPVEIAIEIDPAVVPGLSRPATMRVWDLDGNEQERVACTAGLVRYADPARSGRFAGDRVECGVRMRMADGTLVAGVARTDITPPLGIAHAGWGAQTHQRAASVELPLWATALALGDGEQTVVLVDLDTMYLFREEGLAGRNAVAELTGLPHSHIRLSYTHTHSGPVSGRGGCRG